MELIVLGNYGSFPGRDGACSGYLLRGDDFNILIDCGNGVLSRLQRYISIEELDAIVLSHLHKDHISDMYVLKYALLSKKSMNALKSAIKVFAPGTPESEYNILNDKNYFDLKTIHANMRISIKGVDFEFLPVDHSVESYGMRIKYGEKLLAYSSDTVFSDKLVRVAEGANLFLCESTITEKYKTKGNPPHLSAREAADIAKKAGVKRLLLTHFWYEEERNVYLREASGIFKNTELSEELKEYHI